MPLSSHNVATRGIEATLIRPSDKDYLNKVYSNPQPRLENRLPRRIVIS